MKSLNFDDSIKKLNTFFNDKELNDLYEQLESLIEVINSKPELSPRLSLLKELHENSPLKDLNPLINNEKVKFLHERLETTTKKVSTNPKLKLNIKLFKEIQEKYISRVQQLLNEKFDNRAEELESDNKII